MDIAFTLSNGYQFGEVRSSSLQRALHRLRYQVYVDECGFEPAAAHPDGLEMDEYDAHSRHFAALNADNTVIGTVRLVTCSDRGFPLEKVATTQFRGIKPAPAQIVEVSRLALLPAYRRSVVVLSLIGLVYETMKQLDATHIYMITEHKLWRMLKRRGFLFHQIGAPTQYHGVRIPYLGIVAEMEAYALQANQALLAHPLFAAGYLEETAAGAVGDLDHTFGY